MKCGLGLASVLLFSGVAFADGLPDADPEVRVVIVQADGTEADRSADFFGSHVGGVGLPAVVTGMQVSIGADGVDLEPAAYRDLAFARPATIETSASAAGVTVAFDGGRPGSIAEKYHAAFTFVRTPEGLALMRRTVCVASPDACATMTFPAAWRAD